MPDTSSAERTTSITTIETTAQTTESWSDFRFFSMRPHCLRERQHDQEQDQRDRCTEQYVSPEVKVGLNHPAGCALHLHPQRPVTTRSRAPGPASSHVASTSPSAFAAETRAQNSVMSSGRSVAGTRMVVRTSRL